MNVTFNSVTVLLGLVLLAGQLSFAQENRGSIRDRIPFYDNFLDNHNGWPVSSAENYSFSFVDGKYDMQSEREGMIQPVMATPFDHGRDYWISCILRHVSGLSESGFGLTFSYKKGGNSYQLQIESAGAYRVVRLQDNMATQVIPWTASDKIVTEDGAPNQLKIWKKGDSCEVYINGSLVNRFEHFENEGDYSGFVIENKHHVLATNLVIGYW
jgi:hypothetical protein